MSTQSELIVTASVPDNSARHQSALEVEAGQAFTIRTADRFAGAYAGEAVDPAVVGSLVGPVFVRGSQPGDVLAVEVLDIKPSSGFGYVLASHRFGLLGKRIEPRVKRVSVKDGFVWWNESDRVAYRPMIGKLALAPPGPGLPGTASGDYGGALSNTCIRPGASLWLRAHHDGGLITVEDVHAGMGDGEATASAFEMPADVTLRCTVVERPAFKPPVIVTESEVLTLGQGETLDAAADDALERALELIQSCRQVDLTEAAMLAGTVVDLRIAFIGGTPKKAYAAIPRHLVTSTRSTPVPSTVKSVP